MELTKEFELIYRPNRRNLGAVPVGIAGALAAALALWSLHFHVAQSAVPTSQKIGLTILWAGLMILCLLFSKWMVSSARQTLRVTKKGIALLDDGDDAVCFYAWKSVPHVTKTRNIQRQNYLVVSAEPLSKGQAMKLTAKASLLLKIRFHDRFVIWHNNTQTADEVFGFITGRAAEEEA